ncbi:MAG TPA: HWE histidine kinase domain-containing protein [Salinarimonas sp.]|nr:HWE histidine kinase domain-containing protein [Salinarimonas sp.]
MSDPSEPAAVVTAMPPLAADADAPPALRAALDLARASPVPMVVITPAGLVPNPAFEALIGDAAERPDLGLDPEARAAALRGEARQVPFGAGAQAGYGPVREADGAVVGALVVVTGAASPLADGLPAGAERLALALDAAGLAGTWTAGIEPDLVRADARLARLFGVEPDAAARGLPAKSFLAAVHPDDRPGVEADLAAAMRARGSFRRELRIVDPEGGVRWIAALGRAEGADGRADRVVGAAIDITERRRTESALRESEARFRHMADSAPALIWMTDDQGRITFANMHYDHLFGRPARDMAGHGWRDIVLTEDLAAFEAAFQAAFAARAPFRSEVRVRDRHGAVRWLRCEGVPRLDDAHRFLGYTGCNVDVTDAKVAEERRDLLINELNHRVKNTLATVQSIATQTLRNVLTADQARRDIEQRLMALSRAHDVLTRENWEGASLREIAAGALAPYRSAGEGRLLVAGPDARLLPRIALALAMAFQELATNAVKYGALSNETGRVRIAWRVAPGEDARPTLFLRWEESGGPSVRAPERRGFGSRLIEQGLARDLDGTVAIAFEPGGVVCTIEAPLRE